MGYSVTIGGSTFSNLANTDGSFDLAESLDGPHIDRRTYHVPGTNGYFSSFGGIAGWPIRLRLRLVGGKDDIKQNWASYLIQWANVAEGVDIVVSAGTYTRCHLQPGSGRIVRDPTAKGDGTNCFMDVEVTFVSAGGLT
jgi:hypothetical protein